MLKLIFLMLLLLALIRRSSLQNNLNFQHFALIMNADLLG
uniref:Uncharacterized protein n=1 Tax=Arundo donax TaxID=35708 RepID=A0A0A9HRW7_ARUDO